MYKITLLMYGIRLVTFINNIQSEIRICAKGKIPISSNRGLNDAIFFKPNQHYLYFLNGCQHLSQVQAPRRQQDADGYSQYLAQTHRCEDLPGRDAVAKYDVQDESDEHHQLPAGQRQSRMEALQTKQTPYKRMLVSENNQTVR